MRSHEERVAETKRRIAKIEREKRRRRGLGIHRHWAAGVFTWRMRDRSVLPTAADEP